MEARRQFVDQFPPFMWILKITFGSPVCGRRLYLLSHHCAHFLTVRDKALACSSGWPGTHKIHLPQYRIEKFKDEMFPVILPFPQHMYSAGQRINRASLTDLREHRSGLEPPTSLNLSWFCGYNNNFTSYMVLRVLSYEF